MPHPTQRDWREWYQLERWRKRRRHQLLVEPLCRMCAAKGKIERARIADHITEHGGNWTAFLTGDLQSLCEPCHNGTKQRVKFHGYDCEIGEDGWPTDERHPTHTGRLTPR
jgi:5-methylcytosine-specific restriction protein A